MKNKKINGAKALLLKSAYRTLKCQRKSFKKAKLALFKSKFVKSVKKYGRMEAKKALLVFAKKMLIAVKIRPRLRLSSVVVLTLLLILAVSLRLNEYLAKKEPEIKINGQAVLVAQKNNDRAEETITANVSYKVSPFSYKDPVSNGLVSQKFSLYHRAIDIATPLGGNIRPIGDGEVEFSGFSPDGKGNVVIVNHGDGLKTLYAHMGRIEVGVGNQVTSETVLGTVGLTGHTTGPHLHLEVYDKDTAINPALVLP